MASIWEKAFSILVANLNLDCRCLITAVQLIFFPFFSCSGPKRPHDKVAVKEMKTDFLACLSNPVGFKGYAISNDKLDTTVPFTLEGQEYTLNHGTVLIAAITSCTNTSNPRYGICFWHHIQFDETTNFDFLF